MTGPPPGAPETDDAKIDRLLLEAELHLAADDLDPAQDKAWFAYSHALKTVTDARGWEYSGASSIYSVIQALIDETGNDKLYHDSVLAKLMLGFHRDSKGPDIILRELQEVRRGIARLRQIRQRYQDDPEYRQQADRLNPPNRRYSRERGWEPIPGSESDPAGNTAMPHRDKEPIETHETHSERLRQHARQQLALGDRAQASEKMWGAFSHALKVVADDRHWEYQKHAQAWGIVRALVEESDDNDLLAEANTADKLHENYYQDLLDPQEIARSHWLVERGIARLHEIHQRYQTDPEYRRRADALVPPNSRYLIRQRRWEPLPANNPPAEPDGGEPDGGVHSEAFRRFPTDSSARH